MHQNRVNKPCVNHVNQKCVKQKCVLVSKNVSTRIASKRMAPNRIAYTRKASGETASGGCGFVSYYAFNTILGTRINQPGYEFDYCLVQINECKENLKIYFSWEFL